MSPPSPPMASRQARGPRRSRARRRSLRSGRRSSFPLKINEGEAELSSEGFPPRMAGYSQRGLTLLQNPNPHPLTPHPPPGLTGVTSEAEESISTSPVFLPHVAVRRFSKWLLRALLARGKKKTAREGGIDGFAKKKKPPLGGRRQSRVPPSGGPQPTDSRAFSLPPPRRCRRHRR